MYGLSFKCIHPSCKRKCIDMLEWLNYLTNNFRPHLNVDNDNVFIHAYMPRPDISITSDKKDISILYNVKRNVYSIWINLITHIALNYWAHIGVLASIEAQPWPAISCKIVIYHCDSIKFANRNEFCSTFFF